MLESVTKKFTDNSDLTRFEFEFYCDCCEQALPPVVIKPRSVFKKKWFLSREEREARALIYAGDHSHAYERANIEVRYELNRCEVCGDMVCENCTVYDEMKNGGLCCARCVKTGRSGKQKGCEGA